jgi:hypothetical protein
MYRHHGLIAVSTAWESYASPPADLNDMLMRLVPDQDRPGSPLRPSR